MMPLSLFRSRSFAGANLLTLLLYAGLGRALYFLPFNLIQIQGYSTTAAGAALLPFVVVSFVLSRWAGGLVDRYGAKVPLLIGTAIAAVGTAMFAIPGVGGSYWTTFFPAVLTLGLGMSLVVAPLTTTAMNSVEGEHSGLASGVNNAVSRATGPLAVPVFGMVVFAAFSSGLDESLSALDLPPEARSWLEAEEANPAAAAIPSDLSDGQAAAVEAAIGDSFVSGFRSSMLLGAGLALAGRATAAFFIGGGAGVRKGSAADAGGRREAAEPSGGKVSA